MSNFFNTLRRIYRLPYEQAVIFWFYQILCLIVLLKQGKDQTAKSLYSSDMTENSLTGRQLRGHF